MTWQDVLKFLLLLCSIVALSYILGALGIWTKA